MIAYLQGKDVTVEVPDDIGDKELADIQGNFSAYTGERDPSAAKAAAPAPAAPEDPTAAGTKMPIPTGIPGISVPRESLDLPAAPKKWLPNFYESYIKPAIDVTPMFGLASQMGDTPERRAFVGKMFESATFGLAKPVVEPIMGQDIKDHPVYSTVGTLTGSMGSLLASGGALGLAGLPAVAEEAGTVGATVMASAPRFVPRAIMTAATFGTKTFADRTVKAFQDGGVDIAEFGKDVLLQTLGGGALGVVGGVANVPTAIASAAGIGFTMTKLEGGDNHEAGLNAAIWAAFEAVGSFGKNEALTKEAIKTVEDSIDNYAHTKDPNIPPNSGIGGAIVSQEAEKLGGMDAMTKQENALQLIENINQRIRQGKVPEAIQEGVEQPKLGQEAAGTATSQEVTPATGPSSPNETTPLPISQDHPVPETNQGYGEQPNIPFPPTELSSEESISQHADFIKLTNDATAVVNHHAELRGIAPTPEFAKSLWGEMHDALGALMGAPTDQKEAVKNDILARFPDIQSEFSTLRDKLWSDKTDSFFTRNVAGKYGQMRPKVALDKEQAVVKKLPRERKVRYDRSGLPVRKPEDVVSTVQTIDGQTANITHKMVLDEAAALHHTATEEWETRDPVAQFVKQNGGIRSFKGAEKEEFKKVPIWARGNIAPDEMAQNAYDTGLLEEPSADLLMVHLATIKPKGPKPRLSDFYTEGQRQLENILSGNEYESPEVEVEPGGAFEPRGNYAGKPVFHSAVENTILDKMPAKAAPEQILGLLKNTPGVKQEEIDWLGLPEFLAGKKSVTKDEVQSFIQQNKVQIQEITKRQDFDSATSKELKQLDDQISAMGYTIDNTDPGLMPGEFEVYRTGDPDRTPVHDFEVPDEVAALFGQYAEKYQAIADKEVGAGTTKFDRYTLPGGENYRELLLTLPIPEKSWDEMAQQTFGVPYDKLTADERQEILEVARKGNRGDVFKSSHFNEPNVLAHVRFNDRTDAEGNKVLFIEEVQSDWHQKGRERGYQQPIEIYEFDESKIDEDEHQYFINTAGRKFAVGKGVVDGKAEAAEYLHRLINASNKEVQSDFKDLVPNAPFKKTWHELALKRILRYAAENGYDKIAWTTGEQQAERYDLSKQISELRYKPSTGELLGYHEESGDLSPVIRETVPPERLSDFVGKEASKKLMESVNENGLAILKGAELKVGGEGMKGFYDQMIPSFLNKYTKKWGGRVDKSEVGTLGLNLSGKGYQLDQFRVFDNATGGLLGQYDTADQMNKSLAEGKGVKPESVTIFKPGEEAYGHLLKSEVHSLDITPDMKKSVLQGQSLFEKPGTGGQQELNLDYESPYQEKQTPAVPEGQGKTVPAQPTVRGGFRALQTPHLEVEFKKIGAVVIPNRKINSPADLAYAFKFLHNEAQENFFLGAIKDGRIVAVEHMAFGTIDQVAVYPYETINLIDKHNADGFFIVHNHPSGHVDPSREDLNLTNIVKNVMKNNNVEFKGHVIIDDTKFGFIAPDGNITTQNHAEYKKTKELPILKKYFEWQRSKESIQGGPSLNSPKKVFELFKGIQTGKDEAIVYLLNTQNELLNAVVVPQKQVTAGTLQRLATAYRAGGLITVNSGLDKNAYQTLRNDLSPADVRLMDDISVSPDGSGYESKVERFGEERARYLAAKEQGDLFQPDRQNVSDRYNELRQQAIEQGMNPAAASKWAKERLRALPEPASGAGAKQAEFGAQGGVESFGRGRKGQSELFEPDSKYGPDQPEPAKDEKNEVDVAKMITESATEIRDLVSPPSAAPITAATMRENLGKLARSFDKAETALKAASKFFNRQKVGKNVDFIDRMEKGEPQPTANLNKIADQLRKLLDSKREEVRALGTGKLESFIENYFPHIWDKGEKGIANALKMAAKRPLEGSKSFLKKRTIDTFKEGIEAGLMPVSFNPVELSLLKIREMDKYLMAHRTIQVLKKQGLAKFVRLGDKAPDGFVMIDDKVSSVYRMTDDGLVLTGHLFVQSDGARIINNYLAPGLQKFAVYKVYRFAGNTLNQFQLGFSAFHLGFTSVDAAVSKTALAINQLFSGHPIDAVASALQSPIAPVQNIVRGNRLYKAWRGEGSSPADEALAYAMEIAGGRARQDPFYATQAHTQMMKYFRAGKTVRGLLQIPMAVTEIASKPILEYIVPRQKLGIFADIMKMEMEKNPNLTHEQLRGIAQRAWDSVDNRMGQLVYDNLFWNRTFKDLLMASVRSVGWNLGTIREVAGGAVDLVKYAKDVAAAATGKTKVSKLPAGLDKPGDTIPHNTPELSYRAAYLIALPIVVGMLGAIYQYLRTGKGPQEMKDYFFPRTGGLDQNGDPTRVSFPSYMKDIYHYTRAPLSTVLNKLNPVLSMMNQMYQNKDFYGVKIRNEDDPIVKQLLAETGFILKQAEPFSLRGTRRNLDTGNRSLSDVIQPWIGITPAPYDINQSDAEKIAHRIAAGKVGVGGRTQEQADRSVLLHQIQTKYQTGDPKATEELVAAFRAGKISSEQMRNVIVTSRMTPLQRQVHSFTFDELKSVYKEATPEEKAQLDRMMRQKEISSKRGWIPQGS